MSLGCQDDSMMVLCSPARDSHNWTREIIAESAPGPATAQSAPPPARPRHRQVRGRYFEENILDKNMRFGQKIFDKFQNLAK